MSFSRSSYEFKQIWPDKGDWNSLACKPFFANIAKNLNKFDPIKGIETVLLLLEAQQLLEYLNKFDPIKGIETLP